MTAETNAAGHRVLPGFLKIQFESADHERVTRVIKHDGTPPPVVQAGPFAGRRVLSASVVWPKSKIAAEIVLTDWDRLLLRQPVVHNLHYDTYEVAE